MSGLSSLISVTAKDYVDPMPMDISAKLKKEDLPIPEQIFEN